MTINCLSSIKERLLDYGSNSFFVRIWYVPVHQKRELTCILVVFWLDSAIEMVEDGFNFLAVRWWKMFLISLQ